MKRLALRIRNIPRRHLAAGPIPHPMDSSSSSSPSSSRYCYNPVLRWNPQVEEYFAAAYGAEQFARISKALTRPSCYSCIRVNTLKSSSDAVIKKLMDILERNDIFDGFDHIEISKKSAESDVHQVVGPGTMSNVVGITGDGDTPMGVPQNYPICKCQYPGLENVLFIKGSGPHTLCYDEEAGQPLKEVIVSRKCAEAVLRGAQIFVPGVSACSLHVEKGDKVAVSVAVEQPVQDGGWAVGITRGTVLQGLESDAHYQERNGMYIGQGVTLMSRAGIFRASEGIAVDMKDRIYKLPSFNDVLEGEIFLQNLPSVITARVLDPQQGERILDMCAAPGGKTTAIAILMKDKGEVIATDRSHNKVMDILKLAAEMDLHCIKAYKLDALKSVQKTNEPSNVGMADHNVEAINVTAEDRSSFGSAADAELPNIEKCCSNLTITQSVDDRKPDARRYLSKAALRKDARRMRNGPGRSHCMGNRVETSKGFMPNSFDRVLLDAPCSALGLRPRLFVSQETLESLRTHAKYQRKMFDQAIQLVRPGGVIVYSTCTINPGENEALVRYALDTYKFLSLASQHPKVGGPGIIGHCELLNKSYAEEWLTRSEAELVQRFDPSSSLDTIGFFIAKFDVGQKVCEVPEGN